MEPNNIIPLGLTPIGLKIIGFLLLALGALLAWGGRQIWKKLFSSEITYVTKEELAETVNGFKASLDEIKEALTKGDGCFSDMEESVRTLAHVAHGLCKVMENLSGEDLDCDSLLPLIRRSGHGR